MVSGAGHAAHHASDAVLRRMLRAMVWLLALAGLLNLGLQGWTAREALRLRAVQQAERVAQRAAQSVEQLPAGGTRRDGWLNALFDEQRLQRLELIDEGGTVVFARQSPVAGLGMIGAMDQALRPGALVVETPVRLRGGDVPLGRLRMEPALPEADEVVRTAMVQAAPALLLGLGAIALVGVLLLQGMRKSIAQLGERLAEVAAATARKAAPVHKSPDLSNEVARLQAEIGRRGAELERLRQAAVLDALTGVHRREHFVAHLAQALEGEGEWPIGTLLLVRVRDLAALNRRLGHARCDQLLQGLGQRLNALLADDQSEGGMVGRLNGSDFGLLLPGMSASSHKGRVALNACRAWFESLGIEGGLVVATVELTVGMPVPQALAVADETLTEAMTGEPFALIVGRPPRYHVAHGEARWQQMLTEAVAQRRVRLGEFPVCDAQGQLLHLDCPLRVQCVPGGAYEGARRWLAPAQRGECQPDFDLLALQLAMEAIARDGRARGTNVSIQAMASSDFVARVTRELEAQPEQARLLWLDLPEILAVQQPMLVQEASRRWRPLGVRLALKHAGERLAAIDQLPFLGLDAVRVNGALIAGLRGPDPIPVREHLQHLVHLVHDAGLKVSAEAVSGAAELAAVWVLGFDAATGPSVRQRRAVAAPDQSMSPQ